MPRLEVTKTYKLFIGGAFPRSESGRSLPVEGRRGEAIAHVGHASRKDLREAVEAARRAQGPWGARTGYNRGQILYRLAEMLEGQREDFVRLLADTSAGGVREARREVDAAIDRLVAFAGWGDKVAQVLGCANPVAGPYYNFSVPEPVGVTALLCPDEPALLGPVSLLAPALAAGCAVVLIAGAAHPVPAAILGELCATSDVPAGVVNILTGDPSELLEHAANHHEIRAVVAADLGDEANATLRNGAAENLKRVHLLDRGDDEWYDVETCESPWTIEPLLEVKTIWHPSGV